MEKLIINGKQKFMGGEIPIIEGGFGEGQKVILAKTVAEIHKVEVKYINKLINNNITRFNGNDLMDIKGSLEEPLSLEFTAREKANYKNIFILSQRGHTKLVAMMNNSNDKKWEVMNDLIDEYFTLRAGKKNKQSIQAQLPQDYLSALKALVASEEEKQKLLEEKNNLIHQGKLYTATEISKELGFKSANVLNKDLEEKKIQYKCNNTWVLNARYSELGYVSIKQIELDNGRIIYDRKFTGKGRDWLINKIYNKSIDIIK